MSHIKYAHLGIISCPGSEQFSLEIINNLNAIYYKRLKAKAKRLAEKYGYTKDEIIKEMNLHAELRTPKVIKENHVQGLKIPSFKVPIKFTRFANGEFKAEIQTSVRGMDIFIMADVENHYPISLEESGSELCYSVNDHVFTLLVAINAVLQASAESITVVIPSYPYARQHKKRGREALSAAMIGRILEQNGVKRVITLDIHSGEVENVFGKMRLENLHASYQILRQLSQLVDFLHDDLVVVSPDTGAVGRNKFYAGNLKIPLALIYKERDYSRTSSNASDSNITNMKLLGDVKEKTVFISDDMLGTGGTMIKAMEYLKSLGAKRIICAVSLPLFSGDAIDHFDQAYKQGLFHKIIGTNAIYHNDKLLNKEWYVCANISNLFARTVLRLHEGRSLSPLLDNSAIIQKLFKR